MFRFDREIVTVREKYDDATKNVKFAGNELGTLFNEKVAKIKETCSGYFVKTDYKLEEVSRDTVAIGQVLRRY